MGYKCNNCGNTERFIQERNYNADGWTRDFVNEEGDWEDNESSEETDRYDGDIQLIECCECASEDVVWSNEVEVEAPVTDWKERLSR